MIVWPSPPDQIDATPYGFLLHLWRYRVLIGLVMAASVIMAAFWCWLGDQRSLWRAEVVLAVKGEAVPFVSARALSRELGLRAQIGLASVTVEGRLEILHLIVSGNDGEALPGAANRLAEALSVDIDGPRLAMWKRARAAWAVWEASQAHAAAKDAIMEHYPLVILGRSTREPERVAPSTEPPEPWVRIVDPAAQSMRTIPSWFNRLAGAGVGAFILMLMVVPGIEHVRYEQERRCHPTEAC